MTLHADRHHQHRHDALLRAAVAILLCLVLTVLVAAPTWGATVTIQPSTADSYLREDQSGNNFGTNTTMNVQSRSGGRDRRAIVQFSLSAIPAGSSIIAARLELFMTAATAATRTYDVHRVTRTWTQADVSWDDATNTTTWTNGGGDFSAAATDAITTGTVSNVWLSWDVTADVQAWYTGAVTNRGHLVKDNQENSSTTYAATFATRENGTSANRPRLVVTYTPPDLQITGMTVDPSAFNDDTVTVTMTVTNQGPVPVTNLTPSALTTGGTATKTYVSGPTPASVGSLDSGASATFTWIYTITGSTGQTYSFTGSVSADGGIMSAPATTNTGSVATYSLTVSPMAVIAGSTNVQVAFTIQNGLSAGTLDRVTITDPSPTIWQFTDPAWGNNDTSGWTKSLPNGNQFRFTSPSTGQNIQAGASKTFIVTFSTIGNPSVDTGYTFSVAVRRTGAGTTTQNVTLTVKVPSLQVQSITVDQSVVTGGNATVTMTVKNNGSVDLDGVTPSALTTGGTATKALQTGPTPATVTTLAADATATFQWTYQITGTTGQTYSFTGNATATISGVGVTAVSATSNTGSIVAYGLTVTPNALTVGATSVQMQFTVTNNLASGTVDQVTVTNPNTAVFVSDGTWGNNDGSGWTRSQPVANQYRFASPAAAQDIAANGGSKTFTVTFTSIADPGSDSSTHSFSVAIRQRGGGTTTVTRTVTVTKYVVALQSVSPASIPADGVTTSRVTVRLTLGGVAQASQTIAFTTTAGTFSGSSSTTATTNASGDAFADLTSSVSGTDVTATVTASYASTASTTASVTFAAVSLSLTAVPGTVPADGTTTATLTATLTSGGTGLSGRTIAFSAPSGTLSAASAVTNGSGQATVTIQATTASKSTSTPSVTASYGGLSSLQSVTLTGITIAEQVEVRVVSGSGTNTVYWTWPGGGYLTGVLVLRRSGGTPQIPADGVTLNVGDTLGDGSRVVAKVTTAGGTSAADTGLTPGATYHYRAFGYFTSGALYSAAGRSVDAPGTGTGPGQARWVVSSSTSGSVEPTMDGNGGVLWAGAAGGLLDAASATGLEPWAPVLAGKRFTGPITMTEIASQTGWYAIAGTDGGTVAAVDILTGGVLWESAALGDAVGAAVGAQARAYSDAAFQATYAGDVVFVGTKNVSATGNRIYALDAATGAVLWTFNAGGGTAIDQVTGWMWVDHATNRLLFTTKSNGGTQPSLWVLSTLNGSVETTWSLGDVTAWISMSMDGGLYVASTAGQLYLLDPATLTMRWGTSFDTGAGNGIVTYVWEDWLWPEVLFFSTQDGQVWAVNAPSGGSPTLGWKTAVAGASAPLVLGQDDVLWVGGSDGKIHQIRLTDGVDEKQVTVGGGTAVVGTPTWDSASGWLYAGTAAGKVFAIPTPLP